MLRCCTNLVWSCMLTRPSTKHRIFCWLQLTQCFLLLLTSAYLEVDPDLVWRLGGFLFPLGKAISQRSQDTGRCLLQGTLRTSKTRQIKSRHCQAWLPQPWAAHQRPLPAHVELADHVGLYSSELTQSAETRALKSRGGIPQLQQAATCYEKGRRQEFPPPSAQR